MIRSQGSATVSPGWRRAFMLMAIASLVWALGVRVLGPTDLWDQTQPRTVSYTTDMLVNGRWILPVERGEWPATKPPLFNWLAAPAVALLGYSSEIAHKLPSIAALCLCWLVVVRLGNALEAESGAASPTIGWIAGTALVVNYPTFKLGYLARPDMLLTLWLVCGWMAATALLIGVPRRSPLAPWLPLGFWLCVGLAGLTKGPAAVVLLVYALIGARVITGSWRTTGALYWGWGAPLALVIVGAWLLAAWHENPNHLRDVLWRDEIYHRILGRATRRENHDAIDWLRDVPEMALYFALRFLPWSIVAIAAIVALWKRRDDRPERRWRRVPQPMGVWLHAAAVMVVVVVGLFTLSTGKRADYIAAAFVPGSLLAAWWLRYGTPRIAARWPGVIPIAAVSALAMMTWVNDEQPSAPARGMARAMDDFIERAAAHIDATPRPVAFHGAGELHLQAMLGQSVIDGDESVIRLLARGEPFWLVAGRNLDASMTVEEWLATLAPTASLRRTVTGVETPGSSQIGWPERLWLYEVQP